MSKEWTEAKLREVVEREWGPQAYISYGERQVGEVHSWVQAVNIAGAHKRPAVLIDADGISDACQMLAAAVLAPKLWALMEAAIRVDELNSTLPSMNDQERQQHRLEWMGACSDLSAALAAVLGEEEGTDD